MIPGGVNRDLVPGIFVQLLTCVEQGQSAQAEALQA